MLHSLSFQPFPILAPSPSSPSERLERSSAGTPDAGPYGPAVPLRAQPSLQLPARMSGDPALYADRPKLQAEMATFVCRPGRLALPNPSLPRPRAKLVGALANLCGRPVSVPGA